MSIYESNICHIDKCDESINESNTPKGNNNGFNNGNWRKGKWSPKEDELLCYLVKQYDYKNWKKIAEQIKGRKSIQCLHRWSKILQPGLVKGPWTSKEDIQLIHWVEKNGPAKWSLCAETVKGRSGKQCREHWNNSLCPDVKKGMWSIEEDFLIFLYYEKVKGSWKKISPFFEGRTENSIKNRFFSQLRKIAGNAIDSNEKRATAKIKLTTLLNYIPKAVSIAKQKLKAYLNLNNEEFDDYLQALEINLMNKESLRSVSDGIINDKTKEGSMKEENPKDIDGNKVIERDKIESFDLDTLEKEIYEQCDNSIFFHSHENKLDFEITSAFQSKVQILNNLNCTCCCNSEEIRRDNSKIQRYYYLMNKLVGLEKQVQETKIKLKQYEDNDKA